MKNKSFTIKNIYDAYRKEKINENIDYFRFKRILNEFNKIVLESILNRSECFKMPNGLGTICIVKYRPKTYTDKSLSVDYKSSKELGKKYIF